MSLTVSNCYRMFAETFDCIGFDVFTSPLVKQVSEILVLVRDGTGKSPYGVSQTNGWSLTRGPKFTDE
jgi:hypothetical protein